MSIKAKRNWDAKQAKTNLFAQELKDTDGALLELENWYRGQIDELLQVAQDRIDGIQKPEFGTELPEIPKLLPTTEPLAARELRKIERRDWKRNEYSLECQLSEYRGKVNAVIKELTETNHFQLLALAGKYLWFKDVRSKPLHEICNTAFYGIVGYWLREQEKVIKRGYLFNSKAEEQVIVRELYKRKGEWQSEDGFIMPKRNCFFSYY